MAKNSNWYHQHSKDSFVQQAKQQGYRARAAFKLRAIQDKYNIIKPGMTVVDLGAAPGSWSQLAGAMVGASGTVLAVDLLPIEPLANVTIITGDFTEQATIAQITAALNGRRCDVIISDMSPNLTGMAAIDQPASAYLIETALYFASEQLKAGGTLVAKVFHGAEFNQLRRAIQAQFAKLAIYKPDASKDKSRETYLVATSFRSTT